MVKLVLLCLVAFAVGCVRPGPFSGANYQQVTLTPQPKVSHATALRMNRDAATRLMSQSGVEVVGKSEFRIDSDEIGGDSLDDQAEAQAKLVGANVVILFQLNEGKVAKTKIVQKKSEFQQAAEAIPMGVGGQMRSTHSSGSSSTTHTSTSSSSFGTSGAATLGMLTALLPGSITEEEVRYEADLFEVHAVFLRDPNYPGL